jgi:hypothetical protein
LAILVGDIVSQEKPCEEKFQRIEKCCEMGEGDYICFGGHDQLVKENTRSLKPPDNSFTKHHYEIRL